MEIPPPNVPSKIGFPVRVNTIIMTGNPENPVFPQSNSRGNFCIGTSCFKKTLVFKSGQPETEIPPPSDSHATPHPLGATGAECVRSLRGKGETICFVRRGKCTPHTHTGCYAQEEKLSAPCSGISARSLQAKKRASMYEHTTHMALRPRIFHIRLLL